MTGAPYTFAEARKAAESASRAQVEAEKNMREGSKDFAEKEERYRVALAKRVVELRGEGIAWSACGDVARGDEHVARLRRERDIAEGVCEALKHAAWRRAADRRDTERFCDWSMRRDLAEGYGRQPEPEYEAPIGARRAA